MTQISGVLLQLPTGAITDQTVSGSAQIDPTKMAQRPLQKFTVPWTSFRVWDAYTTNPPSSAGTDDLALITGTWATNAAKVNAGDVKTLSSTRRILAFVPVPDNYQDGETVTIRIRAGMETTVASSLCTVDAEAIVRNGSGVASADLVTTSAQSMNSLTPADFDFQLNPSLLDPGMLIELRISIAYTDVATGTAVTPTIYGVDLLVDTRG